jgi:hypothetical protein
MKKILTVYDQKERSQGALDLSCYLSKLTHSKLTGVFPGYKSDALARVYARFIENVAPSLVLSRKTRAHIEETIEHFKQACLKKQVPFVIHKDNEDPDTDLITESLFADVMVVDSGLSFDEEDDEVPSRLITKLLTHAKCPVIIASNVFDVIDEIVFAYDGTYSSIFAIKQFAYLFPELRNKKMLVVEVTNKGSLDYPDRLNEWLSDNFDEIVYEVLRGDPANRIFEMVMSKPKALLVTGAFGRSSFSSFFRSSAADDILTFSNSPLFIAHH